MMSWFVMFLSVLSATSHRCIVTCEIRPARWSRGLSVHITRRVRKTKVRGLRRRKQRNKANIRKSCTKTSLPSNSLIDLTSALVDSIDEPTMRHLDMKRHWASYSSRTKKASTDSSRINLEKWSAFVKIFIIPTVGFGQQWDGELYTPTSVANNR
jgi:hypothetical protein